MQVLKNEKIYLIEYKEKKRIVSTNKAFFEFFYKDKITNKIKKDSQVKNKGIEIAIEIELNSSIKNNFSENKNFKIKSFFKQNIIIINHLQLKENFTTKDLKTLFNDLPNVKDEISFFNFLKENLIMKKHNQKEILNTNITKNKKISQDLINILNDLSL